MSDVVARDDIEKFISNSFPEHLDVIRAHYTEFLDGVFNHSDITPSLTALPTYFNQFIRSEAPLTISPLLVYDKALAQFSHYDIRNLIGLSIVDEGTSFYTAFFAHFFERFELFYADGEENRYETLSGVIYTDEGHLTDADTFTDDGVGTGPYCILAQVMFSMLERATVAARYADAFKLLTFMKPARLFVFLIPTVDIRFNQLLSGDPEYVPSLVTGADRPFTLTPILTDRPGDLITDLAPTPWNTEGGITTDYFSIEAYLLGLDTINVKYADAPNDLITLTQLAKNVYVIPKGDRFFYAIECEIPKEVVYVELTGSQSIFSVDVEKPLYLKAFNTDGAMRLRISWNVPFGEGPIS